MQQQVPIFKIAADQGTHPPVGLDRPVCVVGRHDYVNLPLPAKAVSKLHALIVRERGRVYLRDLASTNGVEVNGAPVRETGLSDKDIVRIGAFTLRCERGFGKKGARPTNNGSADGEPDGDGDASGDGDGAVARAPQAELRGQAGNFSFPPGRHTLLIGQREGCEVRLKHPSILPVHAVVFELDGTHYIQTFAPEIMTRVNGKPIHREALQPGDEVRVGDVRLKYALVDLSAESVGQGPASSSSSRSGTGTGDSLIQPVLDSSIAPAIAGGDDDPAHHGELEAEAAEVAEDVAFDVVDGEHEESLIAPAMESSIGPAVASSAAAADTPVEQTDDLGLDIEPLDESAPLTEASLDIEPLDVEPLDAAPTGDASAAAKPPRPAAPPPATAEKPAHAPIEEPVVEPVVERAAEHGMAAAVEPVIEDTPAAPAGPAVDEMARSMDDLGVNSSFDLEPLRASDDLGLEPIDINAEPDAPAPAGEDAAAAGDSGAGGDAAAGDFADSIRTSWEGRKKRDISKLSATYDEDNALDFVGEGADKDADESGLHLTLSEDDAMMPLTDAPTAAGDDADLLGIDHTDLVEPSPAQARAAGESPAFAEPRKPKSPPQPTAGAATPLTTTPPAPVLVPETPAPALASLTAPVAAPLPGAAAAVAVAVTGAVASLTSQAAKLAELANAAGLGEASKRAATATAATTAKVTAADISRLIDELAAKVQALQAAWAAYQSQDAGTPPAASASAPDAAEPFEISLADAPPASS